MSQRQMTLQPKHQQVTIVRVALTKSSALAGRQPSSAAPFESTPAAAANRCRRSCVYGTNKSVNDDQMQAAAVSKQASTVVTLSPWPTGASTSLAQPPFRAFLLRGRA